MSLNNLLPLLGAIIPSLYQARYSLPQDIVYNVFLSKFTYNLIWSLFVVILTYMTIFLDILNQQVVFLWGGSEKCMTVIHYIIAFGLGLLYLANLVFDGLLQKYRNMRSIWIAYVLLNLFCLMVTAHILFINYVFTIRS